jgi:hypothetical protein
LYVVGLGLGDKKDITVKGLEAWPDTGPQTTPSPSSFLSLLSLHIPTSTKLL